MTRSQNNSIDFKSLVLVGFGVLAIYGAEFLPSWSAHRLPENLVSVDRNTCSATDSVPTLRPQMCFSKKLEPPALDSKNVEPNLNLNRP